MLKVKQFTLIRTLDRRYCSIFLFLFSFGSCPSDLYVSWSVDQHNISCYLYFFPQAPRSPIILYSLCVSLQSYPQDLPRRFDKRHTPTCLLFRINQINRKYRHRAPLSPICPQKSDTHTQRELHGDTSSGPA